MQRPEGKKQPLGESGRPLLSKQSPAKEFRADWRSNSWPTTGTILALIEQKLRLNNRKPMNEWQSGRFQFIGPTQLIKTTAAREASSGSGSRLVNCRLALVSHGSQTPRARVAMINCPGLVETSGLWQAFVVIYLFSVAEAPNGLLLLPGYIELARPVRRWSNRRFVRPLGAKDFVDSTIGGVAWLAKVAINQRLDNRRAHPASSVKVPTSSGWPNRTGRGFFWFLLCSLSLYAIETKRAL